MVPAAVSRKKGRLNKESLIGRELSFKSETLHQQSCAATTRHPPAGGANAKHSGSPQRRFPLDRRQPLDCSLHLLSTPVVESAA